MGLLLCTVIDAMQTRTLTKEERALIVGMDRGIKSSHIAENLDMPQSTISTILTK